MCEGFGFGSTSIAAGAESRSGRLSLDTGYWKKWYKTQTLALGQSSSVVCGVPVFVFLNFVMLALAGWN